MEISTLNKILVEADFKTAQKKFIDQGVDEEIVKQYLDAFKKLRDTRDLGEHKDIDQWGKKPWEDFKKFVETTKEEKTKTQERKLKKIEGAELIYEDDDWYGYKIITHKAAMLYGSGTKWCITQQNSHLWSEYLFKGSCFYFFISKTKDSDDSCYKLAVEYNIKTNTHTLWNALDKTIKISSEDDVETIFSDPHAPVWEKIKKLDYFDPEPVYVELDWGNYIIDSITVETRLGTKQHYPIIKYPLASDEKDFDLVFETNEHFINIKLNSKLLLNLSKNTGNPSATIQNYLSYVMPFEVFTTQRIRKDASLRNDFKNDTGFTLKYKNWDKTNLDVLLNTLDIYKYPNANSKFSFADFKSVQTKFAAQGIDSEIVKQYLGDFKKLRDTRDLGEHKDIDTWGKKPWKEFKDFVDKTKEGKTKSQEKTLTKTEGAELVYEDDDWRIYKILTYEAAALYGSGTKWCITQPDHWWYYIKQGNCFYFLISKVSDSSNSHYKIAVKVPKNNKEYPEYWNAKDKEFEPSDALEELERYQYFTWFEVEVPTLEIDWTKPRFLRRSVETLFGYEFDLTANGEKFGGCIELSLAVSNRKIHLYLLAEIDGVDYDLLDNNFDSEYGVSTYFSGYCFDKDIGHDFLVETGHKLAQKNLSKDHLIKLIKDLLEANKKANPHKKVGAKIRINASFTTVREKFIKQGIDTELVKTYIEDFKKLRNSRDLGDNKDIELWGKKGWDEFKKFVDKTKKEKTKSQKIKQVKNKGATLVDEKQQQNRQSSFREALSHITEADFKTVKKKFAAQGIDIELVKQYLDEYKELRDKQHFQGQEKNIDYWGKKPWDEFKKFVDKSKEEKSKSEQKKIQKSEGAELVFEDSDWRVYKISTHEAAMLYGSGTKWCITQEDGKYWRDYIRKGYCFYFLISKMKSPSDDFYKLAVQCSRDKVNDLTDIKYWNVLDHSYPESELESQVELPNYNYTWFKTELPKLEVSVDSIIERLRDLIEREEEYRTDPRDSPYIEYLYNEENFNFESHVSREIEENLKYLQEVSGDLTRDIERITDIKSSNHYYKTNEISSVTLGEGEIEIPEDIVEEIEELSEEDLKEIEREFSYRKSRYGSYLYFGNDYDRLILVVNEDMLNELVEDYKEDEEEDGENEEDKDEKKENDGENEEEDEYKKAISHLSKADFKSVKKKLAAQGVDVEVVKQYLEDFKILRDRGKISGDEKNIDFWGKKPWIEFKQFVDKAKEEKTKTEEKKLQKSEGAELVYENADWRIYKILTHEAAMLYGSGTKWCITQPDGKHWRSYARQGYCFYFMISKTLDKTDEYHKIAVQRKKDTDRLTFWDATDASHSLESLEGILRIFMPEDFGFEWFKIELSKRKVNLEDLIKRINRHVENLEEYRTNIEENSEMVDCLFSDLDNSISYYKNWDELERNVFSDLRESTLEKIKGIFGLCEDGFATGAGEELNFMYTLKEVSDVEDASMYRVTNEIASVQLGQGEDELDEEFMEDIDSLSEEELEQLERKTPYINGMVYYGGEYDRFVLVINDKKLDKFIDEYGIIYTNEDEE